MRSDLPKVVHEVAGRPMVCWVVDAVRAAGAVRIVLIVGHGADRVRAAFAGDDRLTAEEEADGLLLICSLAFRFRHEPSRRPAA